MNIPSFISISAVGCLRNKNMLLITFFGRFSIVLKVVKALSPFGFNEHVYVCCQGLHR